MHPSRKEVKLAVTSPEPQNPPSPQAEELLKFCNRSLVGHYLEGHGGRLIVGILGLIIWIVGVTNLLAKSPWPSK